jgi:hypothetical protein
VAGSSRCAGRPVGGQCPGRWQPSGPAGQKPGGPAGQGPGRAAADRPVGSGPVGLFGRVQPNSSPPVLSVIVTWRNFPWATGSGCQSFSSPWCLQQPSLSPASNQCP